PAGELGLYPSKEMGKDRLEVVGTNRPEPVAETAVMHRLAGEPLKGSFQEPLADEGVIEQAVEQADEDRRTRKANLVGFVHLVSQGELLQQRCWDQGEQVSERNHAFMESHPPDQPPAFNSNRLKPPPGKSA